MSGKLGKMLNLEGKPPSMSKEGNLPENRPLLQRSSKDDTSFVCFLTLPLFANFNSGYAPGILLLSGETWTISVSLVQK